MFEGAKLKVERANRHINEIETTLRAYLGAEPYSMRVDVDTETGENLLRFQAIKPPPAELPLIIGDAVHNLRGALDLMASEIMRAAGESDTSIYFPFHETRENLVDRIDKGPIKVVFPIIADYILNHIRPHKGGDDALWALNKLDILDKHRLLIPTLSAVALTGVDMHDDHNNTFTNLTLEVTTDGRLLNAIATNSRLQITNYGKPSISIVFGKGQSLEGEAVIPTLRQLSQRVRGIIYAIEPLMPLPGSEPL